MTEIRAALASEIDDLVAIEAASGALFLTVDMPEVAADPPERDSYGEAHTAGRLWVADEAGAVAGFVIGSVLDGNAHVDQVSVLPAYAHRGLGRLLMEHVEAWGATQGCPATTLTTFRDVPWNAPYYARLGYAELPPDRIGPELDATMRHEETWPGIIPELRCAMRKPHPAAPA